MKNKTIIVIDDDESTLESLATYLAEMGFAVHSSKNGITGLELIKSTNPDLVISDIRMSGLNGIELAYLVKGFKFDIPVILISSYDNTENQFIERCSFGYVQKPIDIHNLNGMIDRALLSRDTQYQSIQ